MSKRVQFLVPVLAAALLALAPTSAIAQTTLHVPTEHATIQAAIDAAVNGDTVLVADGTYVGTGNKNLSFGGKAITVQSENGPDACIIDCEDSGRGFRFHSTEGPDSVLDGFTITNGDGFNGGAITCENGSDPVILNCTISNCYAAYAGGGIYCLYSAPLIQDCLITGNVANYQFGGGGIALYDSSPTVDNCQIIANTAAAGGGFGGGVLVTENDSSPIFENCTFSQNWGRDGGGIATYSAYPNPPLIGFTQLSNCLFVQNIADDRNGGGAIYTNGGDLSLVNCTLTENDAPSAYYGGGAILALNGAPLTITNSILWANTPNEIKPNSANATTTYSDVAGGWTGTGNIDADPLFVDPNAADYHLIGEADPNDPNAISPCIDAGDDAAVSLATDLDGNPRIVAAAVDMGAYEFGVLDNDEDGLSNTDEALYGTDPNNPDTDADGLLDGYEVDTAAGTGCPDPLNADSDDDTLLDGDEVGLGTNFCVSDTDADGLDDGAEVDLAAGLGCPDPLDPDSDDDTLLDGAEFGEGTDLCSNDTDADGVSDPDEGLYGTDPLDPDTDADGLYDGFEIDAAAGTGCPDPLNADSDDDSLLDGEEVGLGTDACVADTDADGLDDGVEIDMAAGTGCPDPLDSDSDDDTLLDGVEVDLGTEPCVGDTDDDGLSDYNEGVYGTDPLDNDTDDDGLFDGSEVDAAAGTGCPDPLVADSDDDTLLDGSEVSVGTDPCSADSDDDGIPDNIDPYPTEPGGTGNFVEETLRDLAYYIRHLDLSLFSHRNNNANRARRAMLAAKARLAANLAAHGHYHAASLLLECLQQFVDGEPRPEWMVDCPEQDYVHEMAELMQILMDYL